jgi:hypothetical protein
MLCEVPGNVALLFANKQEQQFGIRLRGRDGFFYFP